LGGTQRPSGQGNRQVSQQGRQDNRGNNQQGRKDNQGDRQDNRNDRFDQRQDNVKDRTEFRQDAYKDRHEFYEDRWKWAVGATLTAATISAFTCTQTVVRVGAISYTRCGTHWYQPQYVGGNVTYIVVNTPPGY